MRLAMTAQQLLDNRARRDNPDARDRAVIGRERDRIEQRGPRRVQAAERGLDAGERHQ
jgi:hypothetical protein